MLTAAAIVDCEALHVSWPQQPVNAWSSLAFVIVGVALAVGGTSAWARIIGGAAGLVGVGSLLFHGEHTAFTGWVHDWSIGLLLTLLVFAVGSRFATSSLAVSAAAVVMGVVFWLAPVTGEWVHGGLALTWAGREFFHRGERARAPLALAAGLVAAGAIFTIFGRTGGPWCDPGTFWQPHAAWHVLTAGGLGSYAVARRWVS